MSCLIFFTDGSGNSFLTTPTFFVFMYFSRSKLYYIKPSILSIINPGLFPSNGEMLGTINMGISPQNSQYYVWWVWEPSKNLILSQYCMQRVKNSSSYSYCQNLHTLLDSILIPGKKWKRIMILLWFQRAQFKKISCFDASGVGSATELQSNEFRET